MNAEKLQHNGDIFSVVVTGNTVKTLRTVCKVFTEPFMDSIKLYLKDGKLFAVISDESKSVELNLGDALHQGEDFEFLVPTHLLYKRLKTTLDATYRFGSSIQSGNLAVFIDGDWEQVPTFNVMDYPMTKDLNGERDVVTAGYLETLTKALTFVGNERIVTVINNIHHNSGYVESTDGKRIYRREDVYDSETFDKPFLVHEDTVNLLRATMWGEAVVIVVDYDKELISYEGDRHRVVANISLDAYPDISHIIPKSGRTGTLTIDRRDVIPKLEEFGNSPVTLKMDQQTQSLSIALTRSVTTAFDVDCTYISLKSSFNNEATVNAKHFLDMLKNTELNNVEIFFTTSFGSMVVEESGNLFLLLPIYRE